LWFFDRGGVSVYHARQRVERENPYLAVKILAFQLTTYIIFLNPARQKRDGVKEDYYV
jgi:hypothetical protein